MNDDAFITGYLNGWNDALTEMLAELLRADAEDPVTIYQRLYRQGYEYLQCQGDGQAPSWRVTDTENDQ